MNADFHEQSADAKQALAGGSPQRVGWFRFYFADQRWEWSEQVQRMHGYEPGTVTPNTDLVLSHKHPDDRHQVAATIDEVLQTRQPFSTRHRIVDTKGTVHQVVVVGDQLTDDSGAVIGTQGYYVDITAASLRLRDDVITAEVAEITEKRAAIEQAKGMLMLVYGIDADAAFALLKWRSQESNVKLRLLAEQITEDFRAMDGSGIKSRAPFDHLLLTADQRLADRTGTSAEQAQLRSTT